MSRWHRRALRPQSPGTWLPLPNVYEQPMRPEPIAQPSRVVPMSQARRYTFVQRMVRRTQPASPARLVLVTVKKVA